LSRVSFLSRTRLEQRFRDDGSNTGWRLGNSGHSMEIGYLNQYTDAASGNYLMEHILSLNLFMNY
jgi:hypothetical protein